MPVFAHSVFVRMREVTPIARNFQLWLCLCVSVPCCAAIATQTNVFMLCELHTQSKTITLAQNNQAHGVKKSITCYVLH